MQRTEWKFKEVEGTAELQEELKDGEYRIAEEPVWCSGERVIVRKVTSSNERLYYEVTLEDGTIYILNSRKKEVCCVKTSEKYEFLSSNNENNFIYIYTDDLQTIRNCSDPICDFCKFFEKGTIEIYEGYEKTYFLVRHSQKVKICYHERVIFEGIDIRVEQTDKEITFYVSTKETKKKHIMQRAKKL